MYQVRLTEKLSSPAQASGDGYWSWDRNTEHLCRPGWSQKRWRAVCIVGESCHKYHFCRDNSMLVATKLLLLLRQTYLCCDKRFVATNTCLLWQKKRLLSQQKYVLLRQNVFSRDKHNSGRDKHTFVATKDVFCRDKHVFVVTNCDCDACLWRMFVTTKVLSRPKWYLRQLPPMNCLFDHV